MKIVQLEQRCNIRRAQHMKSATRKKSNMESVQHEATQKRGQLEKSAPQGKCNT